MDFTDSLTNLMTGLGTGRDKVASGTFTWRPMGKSELDAAYQSDWLAGSIVDIPPDDMTRKWRSWRGSQTQMRQLTASETRLGVRERVNKALKVARLYGGAAMLIGDGAANPATELVPEQVSKGGIKYLHVFSRHEITSGPIIRDINSRYFGEPEYYTLGGLSSGNSTAQIHPSRVVRFIGLERPETSNAHDAWGFSVLQRCYDALRNTASTSGNLALMAYEAKLDVVSVPNLTKNVSNPEYRSRLIERFRLAGMAKSVLGTLLLDSEEVFSQKQVNLTGMPDVLRLFLEIAAGASDIPTTRLLGTSPKGMNATGESDMRNYYDMLASQQTMKVSPPLSRLDELLIRDALGSKPKAVRSEWNSLWQVRENEQSSIDLQTAQMVEIYASLEIAPAGVFAQAIRELLIERGTFPGFEQALAVAPAGAPNVALAVKAEQVASAAPRNAPPNVNA